MKAALEELGPRALSVLPLTMSWPIHSELMRPVADAIAPLIARLTTVRRPDVPYYGPEGVPVSGAEDVRRLLGTAFCFPTLWKETFEAMVADGNRVFIEAGPGRDALARWCAGSIGPTRCLPAGTLASDPGGRGYSRARMKTAVVTGGSRGIGRAISLELASAGARVVLTCQRDLERAEETAEEIRAAGGQAAALVMDVLKPEEIKAMADRVGDGLRRRRHPRQQRGRHQGRPLPVHEGRGLGLRPRRGPEGRLPRDARP